MFVFPTDNELIDTTVSVTETVIIPLHLGLQYPKQSDNGIGTLTCLLSFLSGEHPT